jgi:hypothetical protein
MEFNWVESTNSVSGVHTVQFGISSTLPPPSLLHRDRQEPDGRRGSARGRRRPTDARREGSHFHNFVFKYFGRIQSPFQNVTAIPVFDTFSHNEKKDHFSFSFFTKLCIYHHFSLFEPF